MISKLKRDKLLDEKIRNKKRLFSLTSKGRRKLFDLKMRLSRKLPDVVYSKEKSQKFVTVAFDVPEKERRERDWLCFALKALGLSMIQKSVWVGKTKIPREFLNDLARLRLVDFVEIFEVSKAGSLRHII